MKKILFPAFVLWVGLLRAQQTAAPVFVWGAAAGFDSQLLGIQSVSDGDPEQKSVVAGRASYGGSIGVFGRWQLWRGLALQPALAVSSLRTSVQFSADGNENFRFTDLEIPLHFVLTNPNGRFPLRGSFLLGGRISWNFAAQHSDNLQFLRERIGLDAGLGLEIRLKKWRLQPEFVYSHGMNNLHDVTNVKYDWAVGRMIRDRLTLRVLVWRD